MRAFSPDFLVKTLLYKETSPLVKKNVLVICQIAFLLVFLVAYNVYNANYHSILPSIIILVVVTLQYWLIKKHDLYYPHVVFLFVLPLLLWATYDAMVNWQAAGALWSFPVIVLLFFCLPERLAWFSSASTVVFVMLCANHMLAELYVVRLGITLCMVTFCYIIVFRRMYKQNQLLENRVNRDALTGLYNRTLLQQSLQQCMQTHATGFSSAILWLDVDYFKQINDTYGHQVGDEVLVALAELFEQEIGKQDKVFRMGGEEFLVLTENTTLNDAEALAEALCTKVKSMKVLPDNGNVTISIGVAQHTPSENWNSWLKRADTAMYVAKKQGRNQVVCAWER